MSSASRDGYRVLYWSRRPATPPVRRSRLQIPEKTKIAAVQQHLDNKVASLGPLAARLKRQKTAIPITHDNEQAYKWWLDICGFIARQLQIEATPRPLDVERGLFYDPARPRCAGIALAADAFGV